MKKIETSVGNGTSHAVDYRADKVKYTAPVILLEFIQDEEVWYKLDNGRSQSKTSYDSFWIPQKRKVLPFNYREDIDSTHVH